ncbi:BsaA family SipW-dependent biofilm matrix protein [Vagococcus zengguangii]|uniref:Uncharacterized protein n=1 Tax=Vagococcus zengguangii TaxID=2571750 RepID=A0A4D7CP99_9ENTE|nr:BsaA family SipW-dependent biofilm matrix protein [Vagococcus zengguangii]QCI85925.1 hypothetical protein FA707_02650 [Vagococcus zengguangii]TLG78319.1 hypothetical protein FE258_09465 [Vagococcus zengguangii]
MLDTIKFSIRRLQANKIMMLLVLAFLLISCGFYFTYAWFADDDKVTNHFEGNRLDVELAEVFDSPMNWQPGTTTVKEIRAVNTGIMPALVRISLYESLLMFKVDVTDQSGNGNLMISQQANDPVVKLDDVKTWEAAAKQGGTYYLNNHYYLAKEAKIGNQATGKNQYMLEDKNRESSEFNYFEIMFNRLINQSSESFTKDYWRYEKGYFYYSEVLMPGEQSEPIVSQVLLSAQAPNRLKGSLYQLTPHLEGHDVTPSIFAEWQLESNSEMQALYQTYMKE